MTELKCKTCEHEGTRVDSVPKDSILGEKFIVTNGCPDCGEDLFVVSGVAVWCSQRDYSDTEACQYGLMSG